MLGQHIFKIHAGDFGEGEGTFSTLTDTFMLPVKGKMFGTQRLPASSLSSVEMLAGLLAGGMGKKIVFTVRFQDGKKLLASSDNQVFTAIKSAAF